MPDGSDPHSAIRDDPTKVASSILGGILQRAKQSEKKAGHMWRQMSAEGKWATLSGISDEMFRRLSEELKTRIRDPRWNDAPELKSATKQLLKRRARLAGLTGRQSAPYDAVVGPGSSAAGLEHV